MSEIKAGDLVWFPEARNAVGGKINGRVVYVDEDAGSVEVQTYGVTAGSFPNDPFHVQFFNRDMRNFWRAYEKYTVKGTELHLCNTYTGRVGVRSMEVLKYAAEHHGDFCAAWDRAWLARMNANSNRMAYFVSNMGVHDDSDISSDSVVAPVITLRKKCLIMSEKFPGFEPGMIPDRDKADLFQALAI